MNNSFVSCKKTEPANVMLFKLMIKNTENKLNTTIGSVLISPALKNRKNGRQMPILDSSNSVLIAADIPAPMVTMGRLTRTINRFKQINWYNFVEKR